jgi:hypothetical protein
MRNRWAGQVEHLREVKNTYKITVGRNVWKGKNTREIQPYVGGK